MVSCCSDFEIFLETQRCAFGFLTFSFKKVPFSVYLVTFISKRLGQTLVLLWWFLLKCFSSFWTLHSPLKSFPSTQLPSSSSPFLPVGSVLLLKLRLHLWGTCLSHIQVSSVMSLCLASCSCLWDLNRLQQCLWLVWASLSIRFLSSCLRLCCLVSRSHG